MLNTMSKIGVVCSGGGVRSAYAIGALHALAEVHNIRQPEIGVASSGGAAALLYYLCGLFDKMHEWPDRCAEKEFFNWWRFWRPLDIDYLVDDIYKKSVPDLPQKLATTSTEFYIAATKWPSGDPFWFSRESIADIFEVLRASKAVVGSYGKTVTISGTDYVDGSFSSDTNACILKAHQAGAERIIVIDNSTPEHESVQKQQLLITLYSYLHPPAAGQLLRRLANRTPTPLPDTIHPIMISRGEKLAVRHVFDTVREHMHEAVQQGWDDMASATLSDVTKS